MLLWLSRARYLEDRERAGTCVVGKILSARPNLADISGNVAADFSGNRYLL